MKETPTVITKRSTLSPSVFSACLLLAAPVAGRAAAETIVPAGAVISCMVAEPKISSKTDAVGDPVLCQVGRVEKYGRAVFPYGSYLVGHFEAYQDPGHFVGKGWMELKFDRLELGDIVVPVSARVIAAPGYNVDMQGKIHGNGHPVRDTVGVADSGAVADRPDQPAAARASPGAEGGVQADAEAAGRPGDSGPAGAGAAAGGAD